jgi:hypothetical protein
MAKDFVYEKGVNSVGDFIYVDLLPQTRRGRQFNSNVILALLFALVLLFVLVFWPYRTLTTQFEGLNDLNNDLQNELNLTQEEFNGYNIDLELVEYEGRIQDLTNYRVDFNYLLDDVELQVTNDVIDGRITFISYSAEREVLEVTVVLTEKINFNILDSMFEGLDWVMHSTSPTDAQRIGDTVEWEKTFILEVNLDAE